MQAEFAGWRPAEKPRHGIVLIKEWRAILEDSVNRPYGGAGGVGAGGVPSSEAVMEPYERLLWEVWMPHVRGAFK